MSMYSGTRPVEAGDSKVCAVEDLRFLELRHSSYVNISLRMSRSKCGRCGWLVVSGSPLGHRSTMGEEDLIRMILLTPGLEIEHKPDHFVVE